MFIVLMVISFLGTLCMFLSWMGSNFTSIEALVSCISMLVSALLCLKLSRMDSKIKDNEEKIAMLSIEIKDIEKKTKKDSNQ